MVACRRMGRQGKPCWPRPRPPSQTWRRSPDQPPASTPLARLRPVPSVQGFAEPRPPCCCRRPRHAQACRHRPAGSTSLQRAGKPPGESGQEEGATRGASVQRVAAGGRRQSLEPHSCMDISLYQNQVHIRMAPSAV